METIELFVGSNNRTHKVDRERLETILRERVDGFTIRDARGFWEGDTEDSVSVLTTIAPDERNALFDAVLDDLGQLSIAWHRVAPLRVRPRTYQRAA